MLNLSADLADLLQAITDIESVSGHEKRLADEVEAALRSLPSVTVTRNGDAVVARTSAGKAERVVIAGHLDTVPIADNLPSQRRVVDGNDLVFGRGTCDMKGGVAVMLQTAAAIAEPSRDVTWIFYDHEEVDAERNGLNRLSREQPDLLRGDFAVLMEPTSAQVEGGCQGTLRASITVAGRAAHSARSWRGSNAIHSAAEVLKRLRDYEPRQPVVDGLQYHEGMNAVEITGGIAGNVIPDRCTVVVNYRFAPDRTPEDALAEVIRLFEGYQVELLDSAAGARPGLDQPVAAAFVSAVAGTVGPKFGWTDVARFSALGIPAVNYGPGDPNMAHTDDEFCPVADLTTCREALARWLTS